MSDRRREGEGDQPGMAIRNLDGQTLLVTSTSEVEPGADYTSDFGTGDVHPRREKATKTSVFDDLLNP